MDILARMEDKYPSLSAKKKSLVKYIVAHWEAVAFMSARELADEVGVSESLVVRFAKDLGLDGYPQLQRQIQALLRRRLPLIERLDRSLTKGTKDPVGLVYQNALGNVENTFRYLPEGVLLTLATRILSAPMVVTLGLGNSAALASLAALNLNRFLGKVWHWDLGPGNYFDNILSLRNDTLVVIFSFPPYYRLILEAARLLSQRGIPLAAITDSTVSPLVQYASLVIPVETAGVSYAESHVATAAVIDAVVALVAEQGKEERREYFQQRVLVHKQLGWWVNG